MIVSEVTYNTNHKYEVKYICHSCGNEIRDNRYVYCPHCGVKFEKSGHPERLDLDEGYICGLIALAIVNGGFCENGQAFINKGKYLREEGPFGVGEVWAGWRKPAEESDGAK